MKLYNLNVIMIMMCSMCIGINLIQGYWLGVIVNIIAVVMNWMTLEKGWMNK